MYHRSGPQSPTKGSGHGRQSQAPRRYVLVSAEGAAAPQGPLSVRGGQPQSKNRMLPCELLPVSWTRSLERDDLTPIRGGGDSRIGCGLILMFVFNNAGRECPPPVAVSG